MSKLGLLRIKNLSQLMEKNESKAASTTVPPPSDEVEEENVGGSEDDFEPSVQVVTPKNVSTKSRAATTTSKKTKTTRKLTRTSKKELPPSQTKIDSFFKNCSKTMEKLPLHELNGKSRSDRITADSNKNETRIPEERRGKVETRNSGRGRKRLFEDSSPSETTTNTSLSTALTTPSKSKRKTPEKIVQSHEKKKLETSVEVVCIDLCSDSDDDIKPVIQKESETVKTPIISPKSKLETSIHYEKNFNDEISIKTPKAITRQPTNTSRRKPRPCPPYKIVAGTTFAVDAFQFGNIEGVTHYFLSHFHADHYVGLTRKFTMPLILSPITARLVRTFIPLEDKNLRTIALNEPQVIEGVEITAIDANHCPGAVMFLFKFTTGKCILHTGDFRASSHMESEPVFWNNDIDTIYLDTTYISNKYDFVTQDESISSAQRLIEEFQQKHSDKKILYICGAYFIGKEKFWGSIARNNGLTVWTEEKRYNALKTMEDIDILDLLCTDPRKATMHVINMGKISYFSLVEYFEPYSSHFDVCFAIRPSGWEKNSKPQYRGKINIIGVEYSEHSGHNELQRFVTYLNPKHVISTVPKAKDLMITSDVPTAWYNYTKFPRQHRNFQPSITSFLKINYRNIPHSKQPARSTKENCSQSSTNLGGGNNISPNKLSMHAEANDDVDDDWID